MPAIASWSIKRVLALWAIGLSLQAALIVLPTGWVLAKMPTLRAQWEARNSRWDIAERADSEWIAAQRAAATPIVAATGDSLYAVVSMPSGRPERSTERMVPSWRFRVFMLPYFLGIPVALLLFTMGWAKRQNERGTFGSGGGLAGAG